MKIVRELTYEGPDAMLPDQIAKSLKEGTHQFGPFTITVKTIPIGKPRKIDTKFCVVCGENPPMPGRVLCDQCKGDALYPYRG